MVSVGGVTLLLFFLVTIATFFLVRRRSTPKDYWQMPPSPPLVVRVSPFDHQIRSMLIALSIEINKDLPRDALRVTSEPFRHLDCVLDRTGLVPVCRFYYRNHLVSQFRWSTIHNKRRCGDCLLECLGFVVDKNQGIITPQSIRIFNAWFSGYYKERKVKFKRF